MLQDNSLIFFEDDEDVSASTILEINGSALGRAFVFCTLPTGTTAMAITLRTSDAKTNATTLTSPTTEVHNATATDLARGYMFFPLPTNAFKYAQVAADVTGSPAKDCVCGITDAPDNTEVFFKA